MATTRITPGLRQSVKPPKKRGNPMLHKKALLVRVRTRTWTGQIRHQGSLDGVAKPNGIYIIKDLIPRSAANKTASVLRAVRRDIDALTLPWDEGFRILPATYYPEFKLARARAEAQFAEAVDATVADYEAYLPKAPAQLGKAYVASEFPTVAEVRAKFHLWFEFAPVPLGATLSLPLPAADARALVRDIDAAVVGRGDDAEMSLKQSLAQQIYQLREQADSGQFGVRINTYVALVESAQSARALNLRQNASIERAVDVLDGEVLCHEAGMIRHDEALAKRVVKSCDKALLFLGVIPNV